MNSGGIQAVVTTMTSKVLDVLLGVTSKWLANGCGHLLFVAVFILKYDCLVKNIILYLFGILRFILNKQYRLHQKFITSHIEMLLYLEMVTNG